jgi:DNA-binding transcriptional MerR regulator
MAPDQLLLTRDAARILGITPHGVRAMTQRGALQCERTPSGDRIFKRADVEKLARERQEQRRKSN